MEKFEIIGFGESIIITFNEVFGFPDETCYWGGYDLKTNLKIVSGAFSVDSNLYTSTGEVNNFLVSLKKCYIEMKGIASYKSYEGNLTFHVSFEETGHVKIKGRFSEQNQFENELNFEFITDQTFIKQTIDQLELIENKYGGMKGIKTL